jgi:tRNA pseudouridine synthase 10
VEVCIYCHKRTGIGTVGDTCTICCNVFERIPEFAPKIVSELSEYEFESFQVGSRLRGSLKALMEYLAKKGVDDSTMKQQFNELLSKEIERLTGKRRSENPDVIILFDLEDFSFEINVMPVYVYGRYIKRVRNISQTRWMCGYCKGEGCEMCNFTGKRYFESVEELIVNPMVELFRAKYGVLHGAGREDVDARMLGNGRPFVVEIADPKRRFVSLEEVESVVNEFARGKVRVKNLSYAESRDVRRVKAARYRKVYRAKVVFDTEISAEKLENVVKDLSNREIHQKTPKRVLHRRADLERIRKTHSIEILFHREKIAVLKIEADSGLYIKELVSGDDGRTKPSLSELLGCEAKVEKLDVLGVY